MTNKEQVLETHIEALRAYQQAVLRDNAARDEARAASENLTKCRTAWENANVQFNEVYGVKDRARPTIVES